MLSHIVSDLHESYVNEILKPQLGGGEQKPGGGDRPGEDSSEKKVRQAVYDIRYRARRENVPIESAFNQYMAHSSLSSSEKGIVKEKLGLSRPSGGGGGDTQKEETEIDEASMPAFSSRNKSGKSQGSKGKYKIRVTDKLSGKTYVRYATRAKISSLRSNPNISSVEMTSYGEPYEGERSKGSSTAKATAGKGLDPVGKEDGDVNNDGKKDNTDKYLLNRRKTIGKEIAKGDKKESFEVEVPDKDLGKLAKKASKRVDTNVSGHVNKKDKSMGEYGEFVPSPDGKKKIVTKIGESAVGDRAKKVVDSQRRGYHGDSHEVDDLLKKTEKAVLDAKKSARIPKYGKVTPSMPTESFSDWRSDLKEVIDPEDGEKTVKEKKVNNKIVINPLLKTESVKKVDEAVYGGKKEEPKDTRMTVTNADKKGNTPAYQNYKAGDKRYKAGAGLEENSEPSSKADLQKKQQITKQQQMLQKKILLQKQQLQLQKQGKLPTGHPMEQTDPAFDKVRNTIIKKHGAAALVGTPENKAASEKAKKEAEARKAKMKPTSDTRSNSEKMADAYASKDVNGKLRRGAGGGIKAD